MSDSPFWLGAGRRVRDWIQGGPGRCGHRWGRSWTFEPSGMDFAGKGFAFVHAHVGIGQECGEIVRIAADALPGESPVERESDLVNDASLDGKGSQPAGHHRTGLNSTARGLDRHPATVNDTAFGGQLVA